jgi:hypothetical protein
VKQPNNSIKKWEKELNGNSEVNEYMKNSTENC